MRQKTSPTKTSFYIIRQHCIPNDDQSFRSLFSIWPIRLQRATYELHPVMTNTVSPFMLPTAGTTLVKTYSWLNADILSLNRGFYNLSLQNPTKLCWIKLSLIIQCFSPLSYKTWALPHYQLNWPSSQWYFVVNRYICTYYCCSAPNIQTTKQFVCKVLKFNIRQFRQRRFYISVQIHFPKCAGTPMNRKSRLAFSIFVFTLSSGCRRTSSYQISGFHRVCESESQYKTKKKTFPKISIMYDAHIYHVQRVLSCAMWRIIPLHQK